MIVKNKLNFEVAADVSSLVYRLREAAIREFYIRRYSIDIWNDAMEEISNQTFRANAEVREKISLILEDSVGTKHTQVPLRNRFIFSSNA